jgi:Pectate lyase superfamily protein
MNIHLGILWSCKQVHEETTLTWFRRFLGKCHMRLSSCAVIAIVGMIPTLAAQEPRSMRQRQLPAESDWSQQYYQPAGVNGAINVLTCSGHDRPSWCKGSDIGAWTNSAIALIACGEVYIPSGTYTQTTSIVKPRCIKLHGASARSTVLKWIPTRGAQIIMGDSRVENFGAEGALEDLTLIGPGANTQTCAIYLGGSDGTGCAPLTAIDPPTNQDDHDNISRVTTFKSTAAGAFGVGIQWGYNAWSNTIFESDIAFNGTGIYVPRTLAGTGEDLSVVNSSIQNNIGVGLKIGTGNNVNFALVNTSLDYNGSWAIQNGTGPTQNAVSLVNCYLAQRSRWLQNYGYMNLTAVYVNDGTESGTTLGYLIDNEAPFLTVTGGQFFNSGTGAILNPNGVPSTWLAPLVTSPGPYGLYPTMSYLDRAGDFVPSVVYTNIFNQNTANHTAGTSACSGGTQTIYFANPRIDIPAVLVFDETTKGGVSLTEKSNAGFTVSCAGASDVFDWMVIGNPN